MESIESIVIDLEAQLKVEKTKKILYTVGGLILGGLVGYAVGSAF